MKRNHKFFSFLIVTALLFSNLAINAQNSATFTLKASGQCGYNTLEWEKVEGAVWYYIYRGIGEGNEESMPLTDFPIKETTYKDTKGLKEGVKYCYYVKALDEKNIEIARSIEACAIPTCSSETPEEEECELILQFKIGNIYYWVNGEQKGPMLTAPILRWDRTFLIIRHVVEEVGGEIFWDGTDKIVTIITKEGKKIEFQIGNKMYKVNGASKQIDPYNSNVVPFIDNGRTLIPLRVTGEELNAKEINWYADRMVAELIFPCQEKPCKWICGCILKAGPATDTNYWIVVFDENCDGVSPIDFQIPANLHDTNLNLTIEDYIRKFPNNKYWCVELCLDESGKIVNWKATPERYPDCCEEEGGRIIVSMPKECLEGTTVYIYSMDNVEVWHGIANNEGVFDTGTNPCILKCPATYKVVPKNEKCKFYPESQEVRVPCCPDVAKVEFKCECEEEVKKGGIIVKVNCDTATALIPVPGIKINIFKTSDGTLVWSGITDSSGKIDTCFNIEPGQYKVVPDDYSNMCSDIVPPSHIANVTSGNKVELVFKCKCIGKNGRIIVKMSKECLTGTKVIIYDKDGNVVWSGEANSDGIFDTGCSLLCPGGPYKVVPVNDKCKFSPPAHEVRINKCCPEYEVVEFKCECEEEVKKGRIDVLLPENCIKGTIVEIYDASGKLITSIKDPTNNVFTTGCTLSCPGTYIVKPVNKICKFYPESQKVELKDCCPEKYVRVEFKCECEEEKYGRIVVTIPGNCVKGTTIYIYDSTGNIVSSGSPNANGVFDTDCKLKCIATYKVVPKNENCKFYPESQEVRVPCCPDVAKVEFKCECQEEKKGRIDVLLPENCIKGTVVEIYDANGKLITSIKEPTNNVFTTGCTLPCPGIYIVKPVNKICKFYPESQKVELKNCCPDYVRVNFKCECESQGVREIVLFFRRICSYILKLLNVTSQ